MTDILRFCCSSCGSGLRARPKHVGWWIECPACHQQTRIGGPPPIPARKTGPSADAPPEVDKGEGLPTAEERPALIAVGAIVALLVIGAVIVNQFCDEPAKREFLPRVLIRAVIGLVAGLIGAVVLRAGARWGANVDLPFGPAYLTVLLAYLLTAAIAAPVELLVGAAVSRVAGELAARYMLVPVQIPLLIAMVRTRHRMTLSQAARAVGMMLLVVLGIGIVLVPFAWMVFWMASR